MHWLGWIVIALAVLEGGWFAFDGIHALTTGDYVTPKSGRYAGQLGPWHHAVRAVGIEPRSTTMHWIFVAYGVVWLALIVLFALQVSWAWWGMLICAICALCYLPFGTLLSVVQVVLLLMPVLRPGA